MQITMLHPCGFCAGVQRVVDMIDEIILNHLNQPIYCIGQVVHNHAVNESLKQKGIIITSQNKELAIDQIEHGVVIFSAHGTSDSLLLKAKEKGLIVYDAICPFVKREFNIIKEMTQQQYHVLYIGVKNHDETLSALMISPHMTLIENEDDLKHLEILNQPIAVLNQTTLSVDNLYALHQKIKEKYPQAKFVDEICDSTRRRQNSIKNIPSSCDGLIIVGDTHSNNTLSLFKLAKERNINTILIQDFCDECQQWLIGKKNLYITSGASTSIKKVEEIYKIIKNL